MRTLLLTAPLVALALAGCVVEAPTVEHAPGAGPSPTGLLPGAPVPGTAAGPANATFDAPGAWEPRQWWRFRISSPTRSDVDTRVVFAEAGNAWLVGTDNAATAHFEAQFDISTVGRVRKADLALEQRGSIVELYRWPLVANATWTTFWDGEARAITVLGPQAANILGRTYPAVALEAREGDRVAVRYNYVPEVGWLSFLDFPSPDGSSSFRLDLVAFGRGYNGTLVEAGVQEVYRDAADGPLKPIGSFSVPPGTTFLDMLALFTGDAVAYTFGFRDPDGERHGGNTEPCTANCTVRFNKTMPGIPGEWNIGTLGHVQGGREQPARSELTIAAVELRPRVLQ